jgi:hypothetical protein
MQTEARSLVQLHAGQAAAKGESEHSNLTSKPEGCESLCASVQLACLARSLADVLGHGRVRYSDQSTGPWSSLQSAPKARNTRCSRPQERVALAYPASFLLSESVERSRHRAVLAMQAMQL